MTMDRANPFADLNEFQAKPKPKPVQRAEIEKLAQDNGFPSRQSGRQSPLEKATPKVSTSQRGRRYTTGRNQQINIKATAETIEKLYRIADTRNLPLGEVLDLAINALDTQQMDQSVADHQK